MKKVLKNTALNVLILWFIAIFNFICFDGARTATEFIEGVGKSVEVAATITNSEMYTENDEGMERDYWHSFVTYEHNGEVYNNVFYERTDSKPKIGKEVTVKLNSENPDKVLPDGFEFIISIVTSMIFLSVITFVLFWLIKRLIAGCIKTTQDSKIPAIAAGVFVLIKLTTESLVFYIRHNSVVFAVFSLVAAVVLAVILKIDSSPEDKKIDLKNQI